MATTHYLWYGNNPLFMLWQPSRELVWAEVAHRSMK